MRDIEAEIEFRKELSSALESFAGAQATDLEIHLGDIWAGCAHAVELIERLARLDGSKDSTEVRTVLAHLKGELLHHLPGHIQGVTPALTAAVYALYDQAEARGELDVG